MGFFSSLKQAFFASPADDASPWSFLVQKAEVDQVFERSEDRPQFVYKHSDACTVSWMTQAALDRALNALTEIADCHHVDVIGRRPISNYVAARSGVVHQSPQAIVIHRGEVVWDASHGGVRPEAILDVLRSLEPEGVEPGTDRSPSVLGA